MSATTSQFANKIALITGGTTGIGLAAAQLLQAGGAQVIITGQNPDNLRAAQRALGDRVVALAADARKSADAQRVADEVRARFGRVDVAFLNAGIAQFAPLEASDDALYDTTMDTNVRGVLSTLRAISPLLSTGASVVVNTSVVATKGVALGAVYSASKGALAAAVRALAVELAPRGIRVNAVSPGPIETPIYGKLALPAEAVTGFKETMTERVPLRRFGTSAEVAAAVGFLASDAASYVTGTDLPVDGGLGIA